MTVLDERVRELKNEIDNCQRAFTRFEMESDTARASFERLTKVLQEEFGVTDTASIAAIETQLEQEVSEQVEAGFQKVRLAQSD